MNYKKNDFLETPSSLIKVYSSFEYIDWVQKRVQAILSQEFLEWYSAKNIVSEISDIKFSIDKTANNNTSITDLADQTMLAYNFAHSHNYEEKNKYAL